MKRAPLRRRAAGLNMIGSWTRRSIVGGVVLSTALAAAVAYVRPGQANVPVPSASPTATPARHAPTGRTRVRHHKRHQLAPPSSAPQAPDTPVPQPHMTSGGS